MLTSRLVKWHSDEQAKGIFLYLLNSTVGLFLLCLPFTLLFDGLTLLYIAACDSMQAVKKAEEDDRRLREGRIQQQLREEAAKNRKALEAAEAITRREQEVELFKLHLTQQKQIADLLPDEDERISAHEAIRQMIIRKLKIMRGEA